MTVLIIGGEGQLGSDFCKIMQNHKLIIPKRESLDIVDSQAVMELFAKETPDLVFNFSAYHVVDDCEKNPLMAYKTNTIGAENLARASAINKTSFFTVSTDYVFDGKKNSSYTEDDLPAPLMTYGASKLAGEHRAIALNPNSRIIRTAGLYGKNPCRAKPNGNNFVSTMLNLAASRDEVKVVADTKSSPTFTSDLARQIKHMAAHDAPPGTYHAVNNGGLSWYDFAKLIFEYKNIDIKVTPVTDDFFPANFTRPKDTRLKNHKLNTLGLNVMQNTKEALHQYLDENF